jgi:Uma2 family endonuclease
MSIETQAMYERMGRPRVEQRIILPDISWTTYESLLTDLANQSSIRLTYNRGTLEIMSPLVEREELNRTIAQLVEILTEELGIDIRRLGSTTFRRVDIACGFEPDSCFYIQNEAKISGKKKIDLSVDPPPDLVIEVDITHDSMNKFPVYAQVGVPEIWHHNGEKLVIFQLSGQNYLEVKSSLALPLVTSELLSNFLYQSQTMKSTAFIKLFREWIREQ